MIHGKDESDGSCVRFTSNNWTMHTNHIVCFYYIIHINIFSLVRRKKKLRCSDYRAKITLSDLSWPFSTRDSFNICINIFSLYCHHSDHVFTNFISYINHKCVCIQHFKLILIISLLSYFEKKNSIFLNLYFSFWVCFQFYILHLFIFFFFYKQILKYLFFFKRENT